MSVRVLPDAEWHSTRPTVPRELARGRNAPAADVVLMSQRARLLEAAVEAVAEKGYPAMTVADITRRARVSRTTFYEQFASKEECFLAAYDAGARAHFEHVASAARSTEGVVRRLREGLRAYLEVLLEHPAYGRAFLLEIYKAGERALEVRRGVHARYVELLRQWHEGLPAQARSEVPDQFYVGAVAAINEVASEQLWLTRPAAVNELVETISQMVLVLLAVEEERITRGGRS